MLPWMDRPLALWAAASMRAAGCTQVAFNTHPLASAFAPLPGLLADMELEAVWSHEEETFGTGGGLRRFDERLGGVSEPVLVCNADILCGADLRQLVARHRMEGNVATLLLIRGAGVAANIGVEPATGRVLSVPGSADEESVHPEGELRVYAGMAVVEPEVLRVIPSAIPSCWVRQGLAPLLARGATVGSVLHEGIWADLGTPRRMIDALDALLTAPPTTLLPSHRAWVDEGRSVSGRGWRSPTAGGLEGRASGVWLIGAGTTMASDARLENALVLGDTAVTGQRRDAVAWGGQWASAAPGEGPGPP